jgi:ribonuclease E
MANKMLIDASHPEETRVVVVKGSRIEEFDFEAANRKPLRGNIYLAKVTRVEPSLQAAFIEYGGNRHGFLAFAEIHPDYYQIPIADRQAILADDEQADRDAERDEERRDKRGRGGRKRRGGNRPKLASDGETISEKANDENAVDAGAFESDDDSPIATKDADPQAGVVIDDDAADAGDVEAAEESPPSETGDDLDEISSDADQGDSGNGDVETVEQLGGDAMDDIPERPRHIRRQYKIQEVIKRRQILLVQVVKEERGTKGAALTTYLSLAGRYSVLMPNTGKGGGISRKITNAEDRKRLKEVAQELEVPDGMGIILRTAGASRTKPEIRRDYEYLMRMWESVRELTLNSSAPALVYEEGSLVKRAIRDLYNKEIDDVHVAGEHAYREAKDFMRMLMPSHAKMVKPYRETVPLFARFGVESQLDAMFSSTVTLKSGGYIVINQTEALVAIDINSGRSTREHNIEDTALKTNLEAADEISRQLRLRDLAGLIVIDFIDMEENRNNRAVEKRLKDALKDDRARIQVGRISAFGLLEMSRQRIRTGVLESSSVPCPHCGGSGMLRSPSSVALQILRALEETLIKSNSHSLIVKTRAEVALYVLNQKRAHVLDIENRFGVSVMIIADPLLMGTKYFEVERGEFVSDENRPAISTMRALPVGEAPENDIEDAIDLEAGSEPDDNGDASDEGAVEGETEAEGIARRKRRRRRRRRGGERDSQQGDSAQAGRGEDRPDIDDEASREDSDEDGEGADEKSESQDREAGGAEPDGNGRGRRRRRGRRGGRRDREDAIATGENGASEASDGAVTEPDHVPLDIEAGSEGDMASEPMASEPMASEPMASEPVAPEPLSTTDQGDASTAIEDAVITKPKRAARSRKKVVAEPDSAVEDAPAEAPVSPASVPAAAQEPEQEAGSEPAPIAAQPAAAPEPVAVILTPPDPDRPKRGGWWSRR